MKLKSQPGLTAIIIGPIAYLLALGAWDPGPARQESAPAPPAASKILPNTVDEARERARLLHETIHGTLQVMHRDFFDPDDEQNIPSASLEDMFEVLARTQNVQLRWLGVNAKTMNIDHEPRDDFEKNAVTALTSGKTEFEAIADGQFRFVGAIDLHNVCLKCHVPNRTSLENRTAGLAITIPLETTPAGR